VWQVRNKTQFYTELVKTLLAIGIALGISFAIIACVSAQPMEAIGNLIAGPFSKLRSFSIVIELMLPLMFTSLAFCIILKAREFNLAVDGSFFVGGIVAAAVAINFTLPGILHPIVAMIFGAVCGMAVCIIPAVLRLKFKANVLVTSLMLNYVIVFVCVYFLNYFLRDPNVAAMSSFKFPESAKLPGILEGTRLHAGLFIAIAAVIVVYYYLNKTKQGYQLRVVGENKEFAWISGIKIGSVILIGQAIAGFIAGLGGAVEILGLYNRFQWQVSPEYGWDGLVMAIMARNNPKLIPIFAFFVAYIRIGADIMSQNTDVQNEIVSVIQGIMIVLVAASAFLGKWKHHSILKETLRQEKEGI
jgi:simple sugar transport system permease protein